MEIALLAVGVVGFALLVGLACARPEGMLVAVAAITVMVPDHLALKVGPLPRIGPTRALLGAFLLGWLLRELRRALDSHRLPRPGRWPLATSLGLYAAASTLSAALSIVPMASAFALVDSVFVPLALFYVLWAMAERPGFWSRLKTALYAGTVVVCLFAFVEAVTHYNPLLVLCDELPTYRGGLLRVRSTFFHPIAFGTYLGLVLPFAVVDLWRARGRRQRTLLGGLVAIMGLAAFLTVSRGPWLVLMLELGALAAYGLRRRWRLALAAVSAGAALASAIALLAINGAPGLDGVARIVDPAGISGGSIEETSSEFYRIALVRAVIDRLEGSSWIWGLGPGSFRLANVESVFAGHHHVLDAPDSHYAKLLLEQGLLGLGLFVLVLAAAVRRCAGALRRAAPESKPLALTCLAVVAGFAVANLTVSMFHVYALVLVFWAAVAVAIALEAQGSAPLASTVGAGEVTMEWTQRRRPRSTPVHAYRYRRPAHGKA